MVANALEFSASQSSCVTNISTSSEKNTSKSFLPLPCSVLFPLPALLLIRSCCYKPSMINLLQHPPMLTMTLLSRHRYALCPAAESNLQREQGIAAFLGELEKQVHVL